MAKPGYKHLGEVPEDIFQQQLFEYLKRKEEKRLSRVKAQLSITEVPFKELIASSGFQLKRSEERVAKEQQAARKPQSSAARGIEKLMIANYYGEAAKRGLHVDHRYQPQKVVITILLI